MPSGADSSYSAKAVTTPQIGDQTLAVRITSSDHDFYVDRMYVRLIQAVRALIPILLEEQ